jgi:FdrA protein
VLNAYRDSIQLMRIQGEISQLPGVDSASVKLGTPAAVDELQAAGHAGAAIEKAGPLDVLISVAGTTKGAVADAISAAKGMLEASPESQEDAAAQQDEPPRSIRSAVRRYPDATVAAISVPGPYAAAEARKAIERGLHVFMFSDNVELADEVELKRAAAARGLLMLGPDCGTAMLGGLPLAFVNNVRSGSMGLVGASGTGLQEVSCLIDAAGGGVSHIIGVGGRDLTDAVGGTMTAAGLELLHDDPGTETLVLVAKGGDPAVVARELGRSAARCAKPHVAVVLGM